MPELFTLGRYYGNNIWSELAPFEESRPPRRPGVPELGVGSGDDSEKDE